MNDTNYKYTNQLIEEDSPYLLQHAHNPVNWLAWGDGAFEKAKAEDKLILVSIGYSSCHWCHVMEHESFEDEGVAAIMNEHFVCIKVDREERPDVDQVYMNAVQLMTGSGGWPLNCFTLPDGRPIYGGTYFPKEKWIEALQQLNNAYTNNRKAVHEYAEKLTEGIKESELIKVRSEQKVFSSDKLKEMVLNWTSRFDNSRGGPNRAPKFPLPNNYEFLLHYAHTYKDSAVMDHVNLTLEKMAMAGIFDQIGGGFSRYATDAEWKIPHFEKMLYDNAQLVSLYCHAYQKTKTLLYKEIVYQTLEWVQREMTTEEGAFYAAIDADSEGEEGKFYVWSEDELREGAGGDYELIQQYYTILKPAMWEGKYILHRKMQDAAIADEFEMDVSVLKEKMREVSAQLLERRSERVRPGLDDKSISSWNCMMTIAYLDAYQVFGENYFLEIAERNRKWFDNRQCQDGLMIRHTYKNGKSRIPGFLDDYAYAISMYVKFYEVTFDVQHLIAAKRLIEYVHDHFYDANSGMYFYTAIDQADLVARKMEISDNVIPASNSVMARNLWQVGSYFDDMLLKDRSAQMLANVYDIMHTYGSAYSNWGMLMMHMTEPYYEIAVTGPDWKQKVSELNKWYVPNKLLMGGDERSSSEKLPLLSGKYLERTMIYVCVDKTCKLPVDNVPDAIAQMKR